MKEGKCSSKNVKFLLWIISRDLLYKTEAVVNKGLCPSQYAKRIESLVKHVLHVLGVICVSPSGPYVKALTSEWQYCGENYGSLRGGT